jgi:small subunit ribosomal protein S9|tara:strand:+ start:104 stop:556 length:453 start_codon:yes stop_codon:yes gene_type:complete
MNNLTTAPEKIKSKSLKPKLDFKDSKYATGRRKRSIAKVWVKKGKGNIYVNGIKMIDYFKRPVHQIIVTRPLEISNVLTDYDVRCSVTGGGLSGQAGAIILGISRALIIHDAELKKNLKKEGLTTRDSRVVERKKYGHRKARRSFQFSKR